MDWNRVWSVGRETYVRLYPNPGVGICFGKTRWALSVRGGFEVFKADPRVIWRRTYSLGSRVYRPKGE